MVKCYGFFQTQERVLRDTEKCSEGFGNAEDVMSRVPLKPPGILMAQLCCAVLCSAAWGPGPRCSVWVGLPFRLLLIRLPKFIDPALIHRVKPAMVGLNNY